jgi:hypothetical protein
VGGVFYFGRRKIFMAKRKRKPGSRKGFKLEIAKNYQSDQYTLYIMNAEIGILQASKIDPHLTDGDVFESLRDLISQAKEPETWSRRWATETDDSTEETGDPQDQTDLVQHLIMMNLRSAFEKYGPLEPEDVAGILDVMKTSVKRWSVGMHARGYLTYIEGFLGGMGVEMWQLSPEEVEELELYRDDSESP